MRNPKIDDFAEYLDFQGPEKAKIIEAILDFCMKEFPGLSLKMAWNMPMLELDGKYVVRMAGYKNHISFSPWSSEIIEAFATEFESRGLVTVEKIFHIPLDWKIDYKLIRKLVAARIEELKAN